MCEYDDTVTLSVPIPASHSHTGKFHWADKPVDRCIAPIVQALNTAGILTSGACCGHGKGPGDIWLHDGRELVVRQPPHEPETGQLDQKADFNTVTLLFVAILFVAGALLEPYLR